MRQALTECDLPGIGRKDTFVAAPGERLAVVVRETGMRELYIFPPGAEAPCPTVAFKGDEARQIGAIIGGSYYKPKILEDLELNLRGIAIEWYRIGPAAPARGKSIGELQIRNRTGASIIDIIREGQSLPNPGPETVLEEEDTPVIAAKHGQLATEVEFVFQAEQTGTAHAVLQTEAALHGFAGDVVVINGGVPLLTDALVE